ncbi:MAG: phytoene/squalene synthase family protein [Pseudomonadota bacterium]
MSNADFARPHDGAALRAIIAEGSHSFYAASRLLPKSVRDAAFALYGFCRACDDAIDETQGGRERVVSLYERLDSAYFGRPEDYVVDRAFADAVKRYAIPKAIPAALIEGLDWDDQGRCYDTLEDLQAYAARVAGTVGAMMALVMGTRSEAALARATDLGAAMQLTNIARDVGEDALRGRIYLPLSWLEEEGISPKAFIAQPVASRGIRKSVERLLAEADRLYTKGLSGLGFLPTGCRASIRAAGLIYSDIGASVQRADWDSVTSRARVTGPRKIALVAQALTMDRLRSTTPSDAPALAANQFLIDAVKDGPQPHMIKPLADLAPVDRMLEVCLRLNARNVMAEAAR